MPKFTKIPQNAFDRMQIDAGVILRTFNPDNSVEPSDSQIVCATKGGVSITCVPKYTDMGDDVDNCPAGTMELKKLEGWNCGMKFVSLGADASDIKLALGCAGTSGNAVVPKKNLESSDYADIWWVGDCAGGGMVAVCLKNSLSEKGLDFQSGRNAKGQLVIELKGHIAIDDPASVPMEFYFSE